MRRDLQLEIGCILRITNLQYQKNSINILHDEICMKIVGRGSLHQCFILDKCFVCFYILDFGDFILFYFIFQCKLNQLIFPFIWGPKNPQIFNSKKNINFSFLFF